MKVLIISPCDLPVPAVSGGAVASLMESIVKENEIQDKLHISMVTSFSKAAEEKSLKYKRTEFIWIKNPYFFKLADSVMDFLLMKFHKASKPKEYFRKLYVISKIKKILDRGEYDRIVVQNSGYILKALKEEKTLAKYKDKIYYHLHNDIPMNADDDMLKETKFLLISEYLKIQLAEKCGESAKDRCIIVKNGIDCGKFRQELSDEDKVALRQQLEIAPDKKIMVFVGRINESKGIRELLNAVETMDDSFVLLIIGSTNFGAAEISDFEREIQKKCEKLKDRVRFTGFVHNDELWKYYKLSDMAVLPSMWEEPAGLTMIEAAAAGLPVITTISGGIPEYLTDDYAILIDKENNVEENIRNAVYEVKDNEALWKQRGKAAAEYVMDNFSEKAFYDSFVDSMYK